MSFPSFFRRRTRGAVHRFTAGLTAGLLTVVAGGVVTVAAAGPASAAASADTILYVANSGNNTVSAYDTVTNTVVTIPVGAAPDQVLANASGTTLYVSNYNSRTISVISTATNTVIGSISIGQNAPGQMIFNSSGTELYVVGQGPNSAVYVISTATDAITATIPVGDLAGGFVFNSNETEAIVENDLGNNVTMINTVTNTVIATIPVGTQSTDLEGSQPFGAAFSPNGATVYVVYDNPYPEPGDMAVINTASNRVTATIGFAVGIGDVTLSPDGSIAYVDISGGSTIEAINTANYSVVANIPAGSGPDGFVQIPNTSNVYITNGSTSSVTVVDLATDTDIATIGVGKDPEGIVLSPDGSTAYVANNITGSVSVIDTVTNQLITAYGGFDYPLGMAVVAPAVAVTGISPSSGPLAGGSTVTITGTGFTGATAVDFGTVAATGVSVVNSTTLTATVPAAASAGIVDVTVTTPAGTSAATSADRYTYISPPVVTGISPNTGSDAGGNTVTISGSGFSAGSTVSFGTVPGADPTVVNSTMLTVIAPPGTDGTVNVTVTNPAGTSATSSADRYTYLSPPVVTAVSPARGSESGGTIVTITGSGFTGTTAVDFGTVPASNVIVASDTSLTAVVPPTASAGSVDVTVTNPLGTSGTSPADQYSYVAAPAVTGVSPASGPLAGGTVVTITGAGFTGATTVHVGTAVADFTVVNDTTITLTTPGDGSSTGAVDVTVTTAGGTSATGPADQYTYTTGLVLSSSANPSVYGQPVTVTADVIQGSPNGPAPTGTVTFSIDGTTEPPTALSGTSATLALPPALGVGAHIVTATYSGDANYPAETATGLTETVTQAATATAITSSADPSTVGQPVIFTATVNPLAPGSGTPTGTVTFTVDGTAQSPVALASSGSASLTLGNLASGAHTVTAAYSGDTNYIASTSGTVNQTVNQDTATVTLASSANPSVTGQGVTMTVAVAPVAPADTVATGTVTLTIDGTALPPATLVNGSAAVPLPALAVGAHSITATYSGDATYTGATAPAFTQTVNPAPTTTTLTSSANPSAIGQAVTFTATVTAPAPGGGTPTGQVVFTVDGIAQSPITLTGGQAALSLSTLTTGTHTITAAYTASTGYAASTSDALTQTVLPATTTTLTSSINPTVSGQSTTLTATVTGTGGTPTGTVTFTIDGIAQSPVTLAKGKGTLRISSLTPGTHTITATYSGTGTLATSTSAPLAQTVDQAATTVTLSSSANPASPGQNVALTAVVLPVSPGTGTPTGTVTFTIDGVVQAPITMNGGKSITFKTTTLTAGTHTITATYSGDSNYTSSTSSPLTETVATTTDVTTQVISD